MHSFATFSKSLSWFDTRISLKIAMNTSLSVKTRFKVMIKSYLLPPVLTELTELFELYLLLFDIISFGVELIGYEGLPLPF